MKKTLLVLFSAALVLASCATGPAPAPPAIDTVVTFDVPTEDFSVVVDPVWVPAGWSSKAGIERIDVVLENRTDSAIRIDWGRSSVVADGDSVVPFVAGMKYADAGQIPPPLMVPPRGKVGTNVFAPYQVHYSSSQYTGGWSINPIVLHRIDLLLCIEAGGKLTYVTAAITVGS